VKVALCITGGKSAPWRDSLAAYLPQAQWADWYAEQSHTPVCDYALTWAPPAVFFEQQPQLKAVFSVGAGVDHVLRVPTLPPALPVVRVEDAGMAAQMAHYVLWAAGRYVYGFDRLQAEQRAGRWAHALYANASQTAVGVLGLGVLGTHVARALASVGYAVNGYSTSPKQIEGVRCFHGSQLSAFAAATRVLIVLAPLTPRTENLVNAQLLAQLAPPAYVINLARGGLVDDAALLAALDSGHVAGATLDVFRTEPLPPEHAYWKHPQVTVTPHIAAKTVLEPTAAQIAGKIAALERGQPISGVVDRARGY
jgi:glyoxylate/hydroxypyruvate reductase A